MRSPPFTVQRGIASTKARASCESFRFAPVKRTASGTPRWSQIRWLLLPRLARSVGFGPVWSPPYTARMEQLSTTARDQSIHVTSPTAIRFRRFGYTLLGRFRRIKQPIRIGILRRDDGDFNFHGYVAVHIQNS